MATGVAAPNEKMEPLELAGAVVTVDVVASPKGAAVVVGTPKAGGAAVVVVPKAGAAAAAVDVAPKTGGAADAPNAVGPPKLKDGGAAAATVDGLNIDKEGVEVGAPAVKLNGVELLGTAEVLVTDGSSVAPKANLSVVVAGLVAKENEGFGCSVAAPKENGAELTGLSESATVTFMTLVPWCSTGVGPKAKAGAGFFPRMSITLPVSSVVTFLESVAVPKLKIGFDLEAAVVVVAAMLNPANELELLVGILKVCGSASIFLIGSRVGRSNTFGSSGFGLAAD